MDDLAKDFPDGLKYAIVYNPTEFIQQSVECSGRDHRRSASSLSCWW